MPQVSRDIPHGSELEKQILTELTQRVRWWERRVGEQAKQWEDAENKILAYIPETEVTRKRKKERDSGKPDYVTIQMPYSYAVVLSALTYVTSVFFGRNPVFQYSGRHGEAEQQILALEACVDYQVLNGYMLPNLYTWFYDLLKYGQGVVGLHWDERIELYSDMVAQPQMGPNGIQMVPSPMTVPVRTYAGNRLFNCQPQDFIWDVKHPFREFQKGEYAGRRLVLGWNEIQRKMKQGVFINTQYIKSRERDLFVRSSGSEKLKRPEVYSDSTTDPDEVAGTNKRHPSSVGGYELVVEIIPEEWKLGPSDWPEKWVFTCTGDFSTLLGCMPLGARHCSYPYAILAMEPEGYGLFMRGMPEVLDPIQHTIDWLINSHFYNVRAALNNKFVVDPSRVVMKDVLSPLPGGIIRLKPEAYGTDTKMVMTQMAINDVTRQHPQDIGLMLQFGERIMGVNDQIMGMLDTGGRKTATEVRTSTSMGVNRLKFLAEFASSTGFDPLSKMLVQNTQQYYDMELKMRIAGDLLQSAGPQFIMVNPELISGFYDFVPVDGTLPIDRFAMVTLWKELMQAMLAVPAIGLQYDLAGIFSWVAQLAGLRNIQRFKVQVLPDQMMQMMAQSGNSVPLLGGKGLNGAKGAGGAGGPKSDNKLGAQQPIMAMMNGGGAM